MSEIGSALEVLERSGMNVTMAVVEQQTVIENGLQKIQKLNRITVSAMQMEYRKLSVEASGQPAVDSAGDSGSGSGKKGMEPNKYVKKLTEQYLSMDGLQQAFDLSSTMARNSAMLSQLTDPLQSVEELQNQLFQSANRLGVPYSALSGTLAQMKQNTNGLFGSNDEAVQFTENLNKEFLLAGASQDELAGKCGEVAQALSGGTVDATELTSAFGSAPGILQSIADYLGTDSAGLTQLAEEGKLSAGMVEDAMLAATDKIDEQFSKLPPSLDQMSNQLQNSALQAFTPVFDSLNEILSSPVFDQIINDLAGGMAVAGGLLGGIIEGAAQVIAFIGENWDVAGPIIYGIVAALAAYAVIQTMAAAATGIMDLAASGFFTTLLTSPITWIALAIGAVIGLIYQWVQSVGGLKAAWLIVMDAVQTRFEQVRLGFMVIIFSIMQWWDKLVYAITEKAVQIAGCFLDMKTKVMLTLQDLINGVIDMINHLAEMANKTFGLSFEMIEHVTFGTEEQMKNEAKKQELQDGVEKKREENDQRQAERDYALQQMQNNSILDQLARKEGIAQAQLEAGRKAQEKDNSNPFGFGGDWGSGPYQPDAYNNGAQVPEALEPITGGVESIAENTGGFRDSVEVSGEDMDYLRDLAETEIIGRYTTAEIHIEQTNNNSINSDLDLDGITIGLSQGLDEAIAFAIEGA